jgi:CTP:molybdopterin cytidylyltransferase MocA
MALSDSQTLRDLIHGHQDDVIVVECGSDAVIRDIDTREDYESELRRLRR